MRLFLIQIIQYDEWVEKAVAQQTLQNVLKAERGDLYDGRGRAGGGGDECDGVYGDCRSDDCGRGELRGTLEDFGDKRVAEWDDVLENRKLRYYIVGKNVERKMAEKIAEADLTGSVATASTKRVYPERTLGQRC